MGLLPLCLYEIISCLTSYIGVRLYTVFDESVLLCSNVRAGKILYDLMMTKVEVWYSTAMVVSVRNKRGNMVDFGSWDVC